MTFTKLVDHVRTNVPDQKFQNIEEIKTYIRNLYDNNIYPKMKDFFLSEDLPKATYEMDIVPFPPGWAGIAYYVGGPISGNDRKGGFYINLNNFENFRKFELIPLSLHEGVPGHHYQKVFNDNSDMPKFVAYTITGSYATMPSQLALNAAHGEGWALYTEYLGREMGVYDENPTDVLGYFSYTLWRAVRLVVDTGIHAMGWSRQRAIDYFIENTGLGAQYAEVEIDRYITWPGQATAYMMGRREIERLRRKFEKHDENFDLKMFHRHVLACKGPMDQLEKCINLQKKISPNSASNVSLSFLTMVLVMFASFICLS